MPLYFRRPTRRPLKRPRRRPFRSMRRRMNRRKRVRGVRRTYNLGFPINYRTQLRYVENFFPAIAASGTYLVAYQSSLTQPRQFPSSAGHQPMYFDQMAIIYNRYRVFGFKYVIKMVNVSQDKHITVNLQNRSNINMDTSAETAAERINDKDLILGPQQNRTYRGYVDVARTRGVNKSVIYNEHDYSAIAIGSPGYMAYLHIMLQNPWATPCPMHMHVELTYNTRFEDRREVLGSVV